jgi:hypothetical protein
MYLKSLLGFLLIAVLVTGVYAIPPLPYEFYGTVTVNDTPATVGSVIIAKINETEVGNISVTKPGFYGSSGTFDRRLVVNGDEKQIGEYITFWIGDTQAAEKVKLYAGESQELNLTFNSGKGGSVDASKATPEAGTIANLPKDTTNPVPTQSPLIIAPFAVGLALLIIGRRL